MQVISPLSPKEYRSALKERLGSFSDFGSERLTGFFLGSYFYVTHHAGYEWNRRYTNQKNAAIGHIRKTEDGCEVPFIRFKGLLCPGQLLFTWILLFPPTLLVFLIEGFWVKQNFLFALGWFSMPTLITALIETFFESMTERSEEGRKILISTLLDPSDPFSYMNNKDKIP